MRVNSFLAHLIPPTIYKQHRSKFDFLVDFVVLEFKFVDSLSLPKASNFTAVVAHEVYPGALSSQTTGDILRKYYALCTGSLYVPSQQWGVLRFGQS